MNTTSTEFKTYLVKREYPDIEKMSAEDLREHTRKSINIIGEHFTGRLMWINSYVVENALYCIYRADSEETLREHAAMGDFPITEIQQIKTIIEPYLL